MVNFPLVVSNCALKVSGAFSVSFAGSAKPGETVAVVASWAFVATAAAKRPSAQNKFSAFMAGEFSTRAAKSHAGIYFLSFIERVIRLESGLRECRHTKKTSRTAATRKMAPTASKSFLPELSFSTGAATVFVCSTALVCSTAFVGGVGAAFVFSGGALTGDGRFVGSGFASGAGRFVPTFVPTMMSDGTTIVGAACSGGGVLVGFGAGGAGGSGSGGKPGMFTC